MKKEPIEKIYEKYNQGLATIQDIAKYFNIPIDPNRLSDYQITKFDLDSLSIEIIDTRTCTTHTACYSKNSETLGFMAYVEEITFINVTSKNSIYERRQDYHIGEKIPILETLTIRKGKYGLTFKKTMPGVVNDIFLQDGIQFLVTYSTENEHNEQCKLLGHLYKTNYTRKNINAFEQLFIFENSYTSNYPNHFCFDIEGNLIVGSKTNTRPTIEGACFEVITNDNLYEVFSNFTLPGQGPLKDLSHITPSQMESAILYAGYSHSPKVSLYYDLEICKVNGQIYIKYSIKKEWYYDFIIKRIYPEPITTVKLYAIPALETGSITIQEIDNIINELQNRFLDDFTKIIIQDLLRFKQKLAIKKGLVSEVLSPLSPKLLINKSFAEIADEISATPDEYFNFMAELFDSTVNPAPTSDTQIRARKLKNKI